MNVYIIKASAPGPFKEYKKAMGAPPQNIFSLAAATPEDVGISMCDETIGMKPKLNTRADIVALLFHTPDAPHAYKLADTYRAKGKTVVLGGLHPSFRPDEASAHADALLVGETEGIWPKLIKDFKYGDLQKIYKREKPVDLAEVGPYPTDIIPPSKYDHIWSVLVSRGCVHRCEYCAVPPFFGGRYRLRPVENIVAEIKAAPTDWFELHADNLTADRAYALKLFKALKSLNINWFGESTIKMADDEKLLQAASESGCRELLIGIETSSPGALKEVGKSFVDPDTIKDKIRRFHEYGIKVISPIIFGFDNHTTRIFEESEQFCRHIGIDEVEPVILIPFPGTPLYENLASEKRILTKDWSKYDGSNAVFQPANMTPEELEEGVDWFWNEIRKKKTLNSAPPRKVEADSNPMSLKKGVSNNRPALSTGDTPIRWKSILALGIIGLGLYFNWYWIWGALLVIWGITDLRNRYTYLLDDIPRSESPILYWIVVLMWLTMGLWALSTSPALADLPDAIKAKIMANGPRGSSVAKSPEFHMVAQNKVQSRHVAATIDQMARIHDEKVVEGRQNLRLVRNDRYGFSFLSPRSWETNEQITSDSVTLHLEHPEKTATITAIAIDFQIEFSLEHLMGYMEEELQADLPFIKNVRPTTRIAPLTINQKEIRMVFRQYAGDFEGEKVVTQVGYAAKQSSGYTIIGVFGEGDRPMEDVINKALTSFRLK